MHNLTKLILTQIMMFFYLNPTKSFCLQPLLEHQITWQMCMMQVQNSYNIWNYMQKV